MQPGRDLHIREFPHILISGQISAADLKNVQALMPQLQAAEPSIGNLVFLNSPGGNVIAAMKIGSFLRAMKAHTAVDSGDGCSSACIFVLAGGVERSAFTGSRLGLHRPSFDSALFAKLTSQDADMLYTDLTIRCREYFRDMGIDDKLFSDMLRVPSQKILVVDTDYAENVRLHGTDPAYEEWTRARDIQKHGPAYVKQWDLRLECLNSGNNYQLCNERFPFPSQ